MSSSRHQRPTKQQTQHHQSQTVDANTNSLAPSSYHKQFENLNEQRQWFLKQIQRKKTELQNILNQIHDIRGEMLQRGASIHQEWRAVDEEMHQYFQDILSIQDISQEHLEDLRKIYYQLQLSGLLSPQVSEKELLQTLISEQFGPLDDETAEMFQELFAQKFEENSDRAYQTPPSESEANESEDTDQQDNSHQIRQTFIRLAEVFHPDKVNDDEVQQHYSEIMKEVNSAYQQRDLARLLELEREYEAGEKIVSKSSSTSELQRQCQQLEKDNLLLQQQYENLKAELRQIRRTEEGQAVTEYRRAQRNNLDFIGEMLEEEEFHVNALEELRDCVKKLRDRKVSVKKFFRELQHLWF